MRRIKWVAAIVVCVAVLLAGCGIKNADTVVKDLDKAVSSMESYRGNGTMILHTGQQPLEYRVEVWYKKPEYYRISLTNDKKDITQIVLRNDDGVFVLTPSLNKSFRFQSDWPQNQGQVYLFQTLAQSILLDNSRKFVAEGNSYVFDVMANYQNGSLARQKIWLNKKDYTPQRVEVSDSNATLMVEVKFDSFELGPKLDKKSFDMAANMAPSQNGSQQAPEQQGTGTNGGKTNDGAEQGWAPGDGTDMGASPGADPNAGQPPADNSTDPKGDGQPKAGGSSDTGESTNGTTGANSSFTAMEPSYLPQGVSLMDVSDIVFGGNKGVMMRFGGDYSYTLIQTQPQDRATALVPGIGIDLGNTLALLSGEEQKTLTWTYDGIEYRLTSDNLPENEMIAIAQSVDTEMNK
jgi:outer membrane lipoprotein-sorting protein